MPAPQQAAASPAITQDPRRQQAVLLVASMVSSLVMLDTNVVAVALPTIAHTLNAEFADMQWVITAYMLPFAALLMAAGSLCDRYGRRRIMVLGQVLFVGASLFCGTAPAAWVLNVSRAFQGIGAALLLTAALAVINHSFQGPARARAYAFWGACLGIAITCGPILGGVISSTIGWHWVFLINLPIGAVLIAATLRVVEESRDKEAVRLDYGGVATFSGALFLLTWAAIDGNALGWTSPAVLGRLIGGVLLLEAFVVIEGLQARPMVDFRLLRSPAFVGSAFAMVGYAAGAQVMLFYLPLYLQNAFGLSPASAGISMLPFALPMFLVPRVAAHYTAGWTPRALLCLGLGLSGVANAAMALLAAGGSNYLAFACAMALAGTGAGLLNGETAKAMQGAIPPRRAGMASGLAGTTRFSGLLAGVAGLGAVLVAMATADFQRAAAQWPLAPALARDVAKRFSAGDTAGALHALQALPTDAAAAAATALRHAFGTGFAAAAWSAAGVAVVALVLTRLLMPGRDAQAANGLQEAHMVAPSE
ncbi:MFS transporter [Variovorax paradoxus]|jgi:EmrB/QacA subfamily drug resistance transporter|uniref:MFS transporter n=1 Tax=Variovorax TaxID=34072 RepID=UPI001ABCB57E